MVHWFIEVFHQYGYVVLFLLLLLELLALPLPGEILMSTAGLMVYQGQLNWIGIMIAGALGASLGMTGAYFIGYKLGLPFVQKYGKYVHFGPDKFDKTCRWFASYGNKLLTVSYFIPGARHFTGYFAGFLRIPFRSFAIYAYSGAILWVSVFVTLGKLLGPQWDKYHSVISSYLFAGTMLIFLFLSVTYVIRRYCSQLIHAIKRLPDLGVRLLNSFGRIRIIVTLTAALLLVLSLITIELIQDYFSQEFDIFNI